MRRTTSITPPVVLSLRGWGICVCLLLAACGSKNPGLSKDEAAQALREEKRVQDSIREAADALQQFPDDYTPPPGIKYRAKVLTDGCIRLDIAAALKEKRALTPDQQQAQQPPKVQPDSVTHIDTYPLHHYSRITPADNGRYLLWNLKGLYLLDSRYTLVKMLFRNGNRVELFKHDNSVSMRLSTDRMISSAYYDASSGRLYCPYTADRKRYLAILPWHRLLNADRPWTPDSLTAKVPMGKEYSFSSDTYGIRGGALKIIQHTDMFYTFGAQGDTLCRFVPTGNEAGYQPREGATYRSGEDPDFYYTADGTVTLRLPYDNTLYRLKDASTLQAAYRLDFGTLPRVTGQQVVATMDNVDNCWFINHIQETERYLFLDIAKGYDTPNARKAGTVSFHYLVYDKQTRSFTAYDKSQQS
ncbi:MAG: DUF4933 domain-containing protein [Prevotellaceae bacterium]|jgi:hypothetical protein|nr:DUF4933 domain-containing protein [Prevotellaceae bacterium]